MFYYIFDWIDKTFNIPGSGVFQYISFRTSMAVITSLLFSLLIGKKIILYLQKKQIGETIRDLGLEGQYSKKGTPTMGGIIILSSILLPTLLFARIFNVYVILIIITTLWCGVIGFIDDYIKVFKKDKEGLAGRFKILGQIGLGVLIASTLYFNDNVTVRQYEQTSVTSPSNSTTIGSYWDHKSTKTTIPFTKNNEFDYSAITKLLGDTSGDYTFWAYLFVVIFIITAVSNGANITDGLDGLATGTAAIIGATLGILAYVSGNALIAKYLNIMFIPNVGELVVFSGAFLGACIGFLWYNSFPAQVFMGDTGSLALGGIIATFALMIRKELLIPVLCGVFLVENLSVVIQVSYFKYTKKKYGEGRRIFLMSPLHHHYQKKGYPEPKIVTRFWVVGILLAVLTIVTLKLR
jgi:phospho-N-acetylmuramoyl-pentapeptide-transferase